MGKKRRAPTGVSIDANVRALRVYPVAGTPKKIEDL